MRVIASAVALVLGLLIVPGSALAAPAEPETKPETKPEWGSLSAADGRLKKGCRTYTFRYEVTVPEDGYWALDVSVVGPKRKQLWLGYLYDGANPTSGASRYRICSSQTRPGRYRLKALVTIQDFNEQTRGRLPSATFRLRGR